MFLLKREEWMNLDFMSLKTTSVAAVKGERHKEKILERQKAREMEQVGGINISTFFLHLTKFCVMNEPMNWFNYVSLCIDF